MKPPASNPFKSDRVNHSRDFQPQWDVVSLNDRLITELVEAVQALRGKGQPDPSAKIHVLLSAPGYGKSHLFGRLGHRVQADTVFVFVPQVDDVKRPADHIRWHVVESLFDKPADGVSAIERLLARACHGSFTDYIEALPADVRSAHAQLWERWRSDPLEAVRAVGAVNDVRPFLVLADSLAARHPKLRADVVRALALGWSPAAAKGRRWLRDGEKSESDEDGLRLTADPPTAIQLLETVAALSGHELPLVICCDQIEAVLTQPDLGPAQFSSDLMGLLHEVPCLLLMISCLEEQWQKFTNGATNAFRQRAQKHDLEILTTEQAVEMVRRRVETWAGEQTEAMGPTWPVQVEAVRKFVCDKQIGPRALMMTCADAYDRWRSEDQRPAWITRLPYRSEALDLDKLFLAKWEERVALLRAAPNEAPSEVQEARLFQAVREALVVFQEGDWGTGGIQLRNIENGGLPPTGNGDRPACRLRVDAPSGKTSLVVAVTKLNGGPAAFHYVKAIEHALDETEDSVHGIVVVHPGPELNLGKSKAEARNRFDALKTAGRARAYSLTVHAEAYYRLLALHGLTRDARSKDLDLGGQSISERHCIALVNSTGVLRHIDLFREVFEGWPALQAALQSPPPPPAAPSITPPNRVDPTTSGAPVAVLPSRPLPKPAPVPASKTVSVPPLQPKTKATPDTQPTATPNHDAVAMRQWAEQRLGELINKLKVFGLPVQPVTSGPVEVGPTFARLKVVPLSKTGINQVRNKAQDLQIHLNLPEPPIIGPQPGCIGVDVALPTRSTVSLGSLPPTPAEFPADDPVFPVGLDVTGRPHWLNLADSGSCHLLVGGTTGSGKSIFLQAMLASLALRLSPEHLQFVLIDPKRVTFNFPGSSPYLRGPVVATAEEARPLVEECVNEMERRYAVLQAEHKDDVSQLKGGDILPRTVLVFDEFADLMDDKSTRQELEQMIRRVAAKARAAGLHIVLATQRPEAKVVTPLVRSNLPARVALKVASEADSKLILNEPDAFRLLGRGDLLLAQGGGMVRLQSPRVSTDELAKALRITR